MILQVFFESRKTIYNPGMNTPVPKRPRGRPPVAPDERLEQRSIRLAPSQWAKVDTFGVSWLRKLIDKAKPPKPEG